VKFYWFDIESYKFINEPFILNGNPTLLFNICIITRSEPGLSCYNSKLNKYIWHYDIHQLGHYLEKKFINKPPEERHREVNRVYYYHNKIIVTLSRAIIALNPDNGGLLWKIDFEYNPIDLVFNEDLAYSGHLIYYSVINIETGIKIFDNGNYSATIEGHRLTQIDYDNLTFHKGFIWFTHREGSKIFLLKASTTDGSIIDGMLVEGTVSPYTPVFDENRLYLYDPNGNLFIYEEAQ
jgi:outer membrane protein assembly factor BamB